VGENMKIAYFEPLSRAWARMTSALFKPFNLNKWFVFGFNAFLAGLLSGHGSSSSSQAEHDGTGSWREFVHLPGRVWEWLISHPGWFVGIIFIGLFIIALVVIFAWLSSRGKFMFLDNVVTNRAEIAKPWKQYSPEGNSLFLWRLGYGLIIFICLTMFFVIFFATAAGIYHSTSSPHVPLILFVIGMGFAFLLIMAVIGIISFFLDGFVVPIMYKDRISTTQAWRKFLVLFRQYSIQFILFGLLVLGLGILVFMAVVLFGLFTCLLGFALLIIPYIGTVITLPIWYTFRAFSLEFLAQFGLDYDLFPPATAPPDVVPA
jgi:hypothetical protein